jgi:NAD(P)-dependent dehydrogenase (short-subunit alcohol dehydrogenase family)
MQVAGKVWVVTGGGGGMGRELVLEMLRRGARVAAVDIREDALRETARLAGAAAAGTLSQHALDITDASATRALLAEVLDAHGAVDGLVNNAGIIQPFVPVADLDDAAIQRVLGVNLFGTINMVRAFLPALLERPEAHLANVSSMGGFFPFPGQTMYGASKAAVKLLTEGLYAELVDTNVAVSVIMPGAVATDITANSGVAAPAGASAEASRSRTMPADVAARIMIDGIEKNRLHIYVGRDAQLLSLAIRLAPKRAILLVQRQMKKLLEPAASGTPQQPVATG